MHNKSKKEDLELPLISKRPDQAQHDIPIEIRRSSASQSEKPKYLEANLISRLFFFWVSRIIEKTGDAPFQQNMHYGLRQTEDCGWIANKFISEWQKAKDKRLSFIRTQYNSFTYLIWATQLLALAITLMSFTGPLLVARIINYSQNPDSQFADGLNLVLFFIVTRLFIIVVTAQSTTLTNMLLVRVVKATRSLIFTKFLKLPLKRSQEFTTGGVMNYMLVDAERMSRIFTILPQLIQLPIMLIIAIYFVYQAIGFAFLGVAITIVVIALSMSFLTNQTKKYQKEIMTAKDNRTKRTTEIFSGIKYIKMCGNENKFMEIIMHDRDIELALWGRRYNITCLRMLLVWLTPTLLNLSAFGSYLLSGEELTPQKAFVVVSTLMIIQGPIFQIGNLLNEITESQISLDRIQKFLYAEEVATNYIFRSMNTHSENAIKIINGNFAWVDEAGLAKAKANQAKEAEKGKGGGGGRGRGRRGGGGGEDGEGDDFSPVREAKKKSVADVEKVPEGPPPKLVMVLKNINLEIKKGSFVAILGDVGSGKSSLFHCLFGEMRHVPEDPPSIYINGSVAYVSQKPWVLNDTVKDNILFEKPYNEEAYKEALRGSCLEQDLKTLIKRDETEIGEKGVNLSGGQKARIALARAIYSDKDIYLLDDPLSAVDAHVGKFILEECLVGQLSGKTRVLVTHKIESLRYVDYIYIFKDGEIVAQGDQETIRESSYYREIEEKSSKRMDTKDEQASPKKKGERGERGERGGRQGKKAPAQTNQITEAAQETAAVQARKKTSVYEKEDQKQLYDKLMINEDRKIGAVGLDTWKLFFNYFGSQKFLTILLTVIISWVLLRTASDYWLAYWSSQSSEETAHENTYYYGIYAILGISSGFLVYARVRMVFFRSLEVNRRLHNEMFYKVIRAPVNLFFDRVPLGRLINRFTADLNIFDFRVPFSLGNILYLPFNLVSRFLVCAFAGTMWVFPLIVLFFYTGIKVQRKYLGVYREVFRLSRITSTPVTSLFTESLDGLTHIRSANYEDSFMNKYYTRQNENMKNEILVSGLQGWFSFRINLSSFIIITPTITAAILFARSLNENAGLIGLLITYLIDLNQNLIMTLQMASNFESHLISFERCQAFTTIDVEKDPNTKLPVQNYSYSWPSSGQIELKNIYVKYRPTLPYVLKDVSLKIEGGDKIGVVGRTGSGKSTLFLSILRILEPQAGQLFIDDVDVAEVGLDDLRRKITIIPQVGFWIIDCIMEKDPLLYKGTVRSNLDLLNEYNDEQIWFALDKVRMKSKFEQIGLGAEIKEGGENLSAGEKQLLCIGRAILKKNKIVLIDEATSSIDNVTEEAILESIHENFKDCTVITIAHRLKTIIASDKVLFMADGQVMEFDSPHTLLEKKDGHFYKLWNEYENAHA